MENLHVPERHVTVCLSILPTHTCLHVWFISASWSILLSHLLTKALGLLDENSGMHSGGIEICVTTSFVPFSPASFCTISSSGWIRWVLVFSRLLELARCDLTPAWFPFPEQRLFCCLVADRETLFFSSVWNRVPVWTVWTVRYLDHWKHLNYQLMTSYSRNSANVFVYPFWFIKFQLATLHTISL